MSGSTFSNRANQIAALVLSTVIFANCNESNNNAKPAASKPKAAAAKPAPAPAPVDPTIDLGTAETLSQAARETEAKAVAAKAAQAKTAELKEHFDNLRTARTTMAATGVVSVALAVALEFDTVRARILRSLDSAERALYEIPNEAELKKYNAEKDRLIDLQAKLKSYTTRKEKLEEQITQRANWYKKLNNGEVTDESLRDIGRATTKFKTIPALQIELNELKTAITRAGQEIHASEAILRVSMARVASSLGAKVSGLFGAAGRNLGVIKHISYASGVLELVGAFGMSLHISLDGPDATLVELVEDKDGEKHTVESKKFEASEEEPKEPKEEEDNQ